MRKTEMENTGTAIMYENYGCELTENQTYMYSKEGACIICCRLSVICICLFRTETGVSHIYINQVHLLLDLPLHMNSVLLRQQINSTAP